MTINIAMWSGPRNISTAMMRAWENRPDTIVWDEPLYAAYLKDTGLKHPMREQIMQQHCNDWESIVAHCQAQGQHKVFYQKHMSHHLLPQYSREWLLSLNHAFLIRDPAAVLASYNKKHQNISIEDIGILQQVEIFNLIKTDHYTPPVIESRLFLERPEAYLTALCQQWDIPFYSEMLDWPAGPRKSDGVWSQHWYDAVNQSTGFSNNPRPVEPLSESLQAIYQQAKPHYDFLSRFILSVD